MSSDSTSSTDSDAPSPRLPEATRLGPVRLQVGDLGRSRSFYEDVLGLRMLAPSEDDRVMLSPNGNDTPLIELVERPGTQARSPRSRLGLFHVALRLPDRAALGQFVRHLAEADIRVGMSDHRVSEAVYLNDPDGLGLEVYADRPRETWQWDEDGELAMTTEPLDTQSLVAAAPEAPWTGLPAGTTVGHVHLHVGDLEEAAAFYHGALGLDKTVWTYPGALFLAAGGYHHHLGTNVWAGDAPPPAEDDGQLLEWTLLLPDAGDVEATAHRLEQAGYAAERDGPDCYTQDPWGTSLRITSVP